MSMFGGKTTFNVVDGAHTLRMPGYTARRLSSTVTLTQVQPIGGDGADYPNDQGLLVSYEVALTNQQTTPLYFDVAATDVDLLLPTSSDPAPEIARPQVLHPVGAPAPQLAIQSPISTSQTTVGWVSFVTPLSLQPWLTARPADLEFYRPRHDAQGYVGQIRLWK